MLGLKLSCVDFAYNCLTIPAHSDKIVAGTEIRFCLVNPTNRGATRRQVSWLVDQMRFAPLPGLPSGNPVGIWARRFPHTVAGTAAVLHA